MKLAAVYARVSSPGQEEGTSLEDQIAESTRSAEADGYTILPEHVVAEQFTGSVLNRPGLDRIRGLAAGREVQAVYGLSLDRFTREPFHALTLVHEFEDLGVPLVFAQGLSNTTPEGKLIIYVDGYVGKKEREYISRRTMQGKDSVARSGRLPCGGPLFGYDYDPVFKKRTINEKEAAVVRRMFQWAFEVVSPYQIGLWLEESGIRGPRGGVLEARSVTRMLRNRSYAGVDVYRENRVVGSAGQKRLITPRDKSEVIEIVGFTPPIISMELFEAVQERLSAPKGQNRTEGRRYELTGFGRCIKCGSPVVGSCLVRKYRKYRCRGTARTVHRPAICNARYIEGNDYEEVVWRLVSEAIKDPGILVAELRDHFESGGGDLGNQIKALKRDIQQLRGREARLIGLYGDGEFDREALDSQVAPIKALSDEKKKDLLILEEQQRHRDDSEELDRRVREVCQQVSDRLDNLDAEGRRAVYAAFGVSVQASLEELLITLTISYKCTTIGRTSASPHERSHRCRWA